MFLFTFFQSYSLSYLLFFYLYLIFCSFFANFIFLWFRFCNFHSSFTFNGFLSSVCSSIVPSHWVYFIILTIITPKLSFSSLYIIIVCCTCSRLGRLIWRWWYFPYIKKALNYCEQYNFNFKIYKNASLETQGFNFCILFCKKKASLLWHFPG